MFAKVAILFATLVAVNASALLHGAALAHTGKSVTSRHQDAHGNYAFGYDVVDGGHASSKSQSEVGNGHGFKNSAYNSQINHVAPAVAVAHAAPVAVGHVAAAPLVAGHGLIGAGPVGYGYGNGLIGAGAVGYGYGNGLIGAGALGHGYGNGLIGAGAVGYGYGNGLIGAGALGHGYGNGLIGAGALGYGGHGLLGGVAYGAAKSIHY